MTEPQNQEPVAPEVKPTPEPKPEESEPLFVARTQKDLDKKFADEKREAAKTRDRKLLEQSGAESIDDLLAAYEAQKAMEEELATETDKERNAREKAEKERDEAKQAASDALKEANDILINAKLETLLISKGARADRLERLIKEADLSQVEVEKVDGKVQVKNLEPAVTSLETEIPEWFGSDEQPAGSRPSSRPAAGPTNQQIDKETQQAERTRLTSAL